MSAYVLLVISIVSEVFGSSLLKVTNGFKKLLPTLGVIIGYAVAFYCLSLTLKTLPLGMAYAVWAGLGTALTALVGVIIYNEKLNFKMGIGLIFIIGGVVLLNIDGTH
jgi:multidrug resistance protein EbrA